uniref:Uncharacterized protein n=1 Tax=Rhizophora mucronata TaxID=61149 RepID=A0A2P2IQZ8_RHIMU
MVNFPIVDRPWNSSGRNTSTMAENRKGCGRELQSTFGSQRKPHLEAEVRGAPYNGKLQNLLLLINIVQPINQAINKTTKPRSSNQQNYPLFLHPSTTAHRR